jgi:hypothetical protein
LGFDGEVEMIVQEKVENNENLCLDIAGKRDVRRCRIVSRLACIERFLGRVNRALRSILLLGL